MTSFSQKPDSSLLSYVQTGKKTDKCGYDPYGVECGSGVDVAPGSATPGYVSMTGMS
jgi:hypothetical protein